MDARHQFVLEPGGVPFKPTASQKYIVRQTVVEFEDYLHSWGEFPTGGSEYRTRAVFTHLVSM